MLMCQMSNSMMALCIKHNEIMSVLDLKIKWRKVSDWLRTFQVSPDIWAFDALRCYIEKKGV